MRSTLPLLAGSVSLVKREARAPDILDRSADMGRYWNITNQYGIVNTWSVGWSCLGWPKYVTAVVFSPVLNHHQPRWHCKHANDGQSVPGQILFSLDHRRRINTEDKEKAVAADWGRYLNAAQFIWQQGWFEAKILGASQFWEGAWWFGVAWITIFFSKHPFRQVVVIIFILFFKSF